MVTNDNAHIEWTSDTSRLDFDSLVQFFEAVGFGEAADYEIFRNIPDYVNKSMAMFSHSILAFENGILVGLAHVFSDECLCSWLAEICVHPSLQRREIGRELMARVNARFEPHAPLPPELSFPNGIFREVLCCAEGQIGCLRGDLTQRSARGNRTAGHPDHQ
ncbi:MAG: GNAT family N-acetyltransferase [Alphaproteobacteria bacterium]|nr:GNAT family N-acetyltransferase [Alphaproteobacteria bacterium]